MTTRAALRPAWAGEAEWRVRCDLAACYRALAQFGWTDLIYTHASARHPDDPALYLMHPFGLLFEEVTASSLLVVHLDGRVVRGEAPVNGDGHAIHSAVLAARPDVNWVIHTHTRAGAAVSCMKCGLLPASQHAMMLHGHVSEHDWDVQTAPGECARLASDLGPRNHAMILRNHGLLSCARTVGEAFTTLHLLETACRIQVDAMSGGAELIVPGPEVVERTALRGAPGELDGVAEWAAVLRSLERVDPSFRS